MKNLGYSFEPCANCETETQQVLLVPEYWDETLKKKIHHKVEFAKFYCIECQNTSEEEWNENRTLRH